MDPNLKLLSDQGELLEDQRRSRRLVGNLNYMITTRLDIAYPVSVVSQLMSAPRTSHWDIVVRILSYLKSAPRRRLLYSECSHNSIVGF